MCKDPALQGVPSSTYQTRYLISEIVEQGALKKISECLGLPDEDSAFETYKTSKCLKAEYVLLFCTQETMSQNQPCFLLKHKKLYVCD